MKTLPKIIVTAAILLLAGCSGQRMMDQPMDQPMDEPMSSMEKPMSSMDEMSGSMSGTTMMQPQTQNMDSEMQE